MKNIISITLGLLCLTTAAFSQMGERRNQVEMIIQQNGKPISIALNSISTSITRSVELEAPIQKKDGKDSLKTQAVVAEHANSDSFYMSMEAQKIGPDFLKILADKNKPFSGKIIVTDLFGKNPVKTLEFTEATLYSYADPTYYNDSYAAPSLSLLCKSITIDGIVFKQ